MPESAEIELPNFASVVDEDISGGTDEDVVTTVAFLVSVAETTDTLDGFKEAEVEVAGWKVGISAGPTPELGVTCDELVEAMDVVDICSLLDEEFNANKSARLDARRVSAAAFSSAY